MALIYRAGVKMLKVKKKTLQGSSIKRPFQTGFNKTTF